MSTTEIDLSREACDARLRDELIFITGHPNHWDQSTWGYTSEGPSKWECGTVACLAGLVAVHAGLAEPDSRMPLWDGEAYLWITPAGVALLATALPDRPKFLMPSLDFTSLGAVLFGLPVDQAGTLFSGTNTLADLWSLAAQFTDGRVSLPEELAAKVAEIDHLREREEERW